ncbi:MAG TPA: lipopolysaccharide heptosyltransferase II [Gemmataceae bacterium]|nr:lipopolysaccharide heptosyltransferase II [Gemmataceae bacterium]
MRLAVFCPNWVGDAVMATPALRALRQHFRGAHVVGVMKPYVAGVLEGGRWFDRTLFYNGGPWSQGVAATAWQLRRERIDLAVLFPNSFRSALVAWLGGCKRRIGYARYGRGPLLTDRLGPVRDARGRLTPSPALDAYNLLAERAGCPRPSCRMELFTTPSDEAGADAVWRQFGLAAYPEVVLLNPGAAFGSAKHWPAEHFADLARDLADRRGCGVLVLCGPAERDLARQVAAQARRPSVHSVGDSPLSLGLTKALVRRCGLLVTTDSGPRHFAAAFGRPVVALFGPTHVEWTETYYPGEVRLQKKVPCGPCQLRVCPLDHRCMKGLTPAEVYEAAAGLLDRARRAAG